MWRFLAKFLGSKAIIIFGYFNIFWLFFGILKYFWPIFDILAIFENVHLVILVPESLNIRRAIGIDPFNQGFDHMNCEMSKWSLTALRLCFECYLIVPGIKESILSLIHI